MTTGTGLRRAATAALIFTALLAAGAHADTQIRIGLDTDGNASGSCGLDAASGFEQLLTIAVGGVPPTVTASSIATCDPLGGDYGVPVALADGWPVGVGVGVEASDAVEAFVPHAFFATARSVRLAVVTSTGSGAIDGLGVDLAGRDLRLLLAGPAPAPVLGGPGLAVAVALLTALAWRRRAGRAWMAAFALAYAAMAIGVAIAAAFSADGQVDDWAGRAPLGSDAGADTSDPAADIVALFAAASPEALWLRADLANLEPPAPTPTALPPTASPTPSSTATVTATGTDTPTVTPPPPTASVTAAATDTATATGTDTPTVTPTPTLPNGLGTPMDETPIIGDTPEIGPTDPPGPWITPEVGPTDPLGPGTTPAVRPTVSNPNVTPATAPTVSNPNVTPAAAPTVSNPLVTPAVAPTEPGAATTAAPPPTETPPP